VEVSALHHRGWTISAMARHLGRSRNTIRAYLRGERRPGERRGSTPDPLAPYLAYVTEPLREDPHVWATALGRGAPARAAYSRRHRSGRLVGAASNWGTSCYQLPAVAVAWAAPVPSARPGQTGVR
jgi:transcriptional regulator with XRE-family HTH domain